MEFRNVPNQVDAKVIRKIWLRKILGTKKEKLEIIAQLAIGIFLRHF